MPTTRRGATRRGAAAEAISASEGNGSPPPAPADRSSSKKAQATTTTSSKSKKTQKRNPASQSADAHPQASAPVEPLIQPSETARSSDEVDESVGAPKSPVPVSEASLVKLLQYSSIRDHVSNDQQYSQVPLELFLVIFHKLVRELVHRMTQSVVSVLCYKAVFVFILHPSAEVGGRKSRVRNGPSERMC